MMHPRGRPRRPLRRKAWHYAAFATAAAGMLAAGGVGFATGGVSSGTSNDTWSLTLGSMTTAGGYLSGTQSPAATLTGSSTTESSSSTTVIFQPNLTVQVTVPSTITVDDSNTYHLNSQLTIPAGIPSGTSFYLRSLALLSASDSTNTTDLEADTGCNSLGDLNSSDYEACTGSALSANTTALTNAISVTNNWSAWNLLMVIPASTTIPVGQYTGAVTITGVLNSAASN